MKKFLILYKSSAAEFERAMLASPEQQKAGMEAWMLWAKEAQSSVVDLGAPLGKTLEVTSDGALPTSNDLGGYSIMQGETKEALAELFKGHPHFKMGPESSIEIVEIVPLPGV